MRVWQAIALALLKKFCARFYKNEKARCQARFIEYAKLAEADGNFFSEYRFEVEESKTQLVDTLNRIKSDLDNGSFRSPAGFHALRVFERHLYRPLVHLAKWDDISVSPIEHNDGETRFVEDLRRYIEDNLAYFADQELYLLRNMTRGRGIGFFEAGNFYPERRSLRDDYGYKGWARVTPMAADRLGNRHKGRHTVWVSEPPWWQRILRDLSQLLRFKNPFK